MNTFKKRNIYVHHYASHTQSQNILRTENSYEDRCFMLTEILTNWIMATALRVAKMLPKATKYPLFWSWQKSPAYCTCQFEKNICTNQTLFSHVNLLLYLLRYLNLDPHRHDACDKNAYASHRRPSSGQGQKGLDVTLSPCTCITYGPIVCSVCLEIKLLIKWIKWWKNTHSFIWISTPY